MMVHGLVPNVKHGGPVKLDLKQQFQQYLGSIQRGNSKKTFVPSGTKSKKSRINVNESFSASVERWDSQKAKERGRKKDNYIKGKDLDHDAIIEKMDVPFESIRISGSTKLLGDATKRARIPDEVLLNQQHIQWLLKKHSYIPSEVVDAGLMLIDKRLNEDSNMKDSVFVYQVQILRLILAGQDNLVNNGRFVTIIPRDFGFSAEDDRFEAFRGGDSDAAIISAGSHFTLVSNLNCKTNEVNVYETFAPYRSADALLTKDGVRLLKSLTKSDKLTVNCLNVQLQDESECGAISLALAVQLCFYPPDGDDIYHKMKNVRKELYWCFKDNQINYFTSTKRTVKPSERILFSQNI